MLVKMGHIFISYSHKDKNYAHKLADKLEREGFEVWIDDRIDYGTEWPKVIQKQLDACGAFIVIISQNAYESKWVQNEVARAGRKNKPFFPLVLEGDPWLSFEATQYIDVRGGSLPPSNFYNLLEKVTYRRKSESITSSKTTDEGSTHPLVLPIGQYFGAFYYTVGSTKRVHNVRVRTSIRELDDTRFTVWALLHGVPDKLADGPWTRQVVRALATSIELDPLLDGLIADGLAAEVTPGANAEEFAHRHRMGHRMLGLGNTPEEPWLFSIGFFDQPLLKVTRLVYEMWEQCERADTIWSLIDELTEIERKEGRIDMAEIDPAIALDSFLGTIHHLLSLSAVYVEPRR